MTITVTKSNLELLVSKGESQTLEFKKSTGELKEVCKSICGMLNASGGHVLIGISNSGQILGQDVSDQTIRDINLELQKLEPSFSPEISFIEVDHSKKVIIIMVNLTNQRPYTYDGKAYLREGNLTAQMSKDEYEGLILERMHPVNRWENQIAESRSIQDLDYQEILITLKEAIRKGRIADPDTNDIHGILRGFGLLKDEKLTNAAIALFIKEDRVLPEYTQLWLKVARFKGNTKNEFIDSKMFYGNAFTLFRQAQNFLIQHLPISGKFIPGVFERQDEPLYPMSALREAIANAICHREYEQACSNASIAIFDDRLEIGSTGGLHFGLTAEDLFKEHQSKPWNPMISSGFYKRGIIETWGRGTLIIKEQVEQAGLVTPSYKISKDSVTIVFSPEKQVHSGLVSVNLNERQKYIVNIFYNNPKEAYSFRDLCAIVQKENINQRLLKEDLHNLKKNFHLLEVIGKGAGAKWTLKRNKS